MVNQQESLQYNIFMDGIVLSELILHKKHTLTDDSKLDFIKSYITMSAPEQYTHLGLGRGTVTLMRQKLLAYISSLPDPTGFSRIPINSKEPFLINKEGVVIRLSDRMIVKPMLDSSGYYRSSLVHTRPNGTVIDYERTHRLMGLTFLPNPDNKRTINHIDGNKLNNNLTNLEWATDSENCQHAHDTGLSPKQNWARPERRTFTEEQRLHVANSASCITTAALARQFNLTESTVRNIRQNKHKDLL